MITNKYGKKCVSCSAFVTVGKGFAFKQAGTWGTVCASTACHRKLGLDQQAAAVTNAPRVLTAAGAVCMPYDAAALPLLRAMPGARWDSVAKHWTVSLAMKDRERVLELADRLNLDVAGELRNVQYDVTTTQAAARAAAAGAYAYQVKGVEWLSAHPKALLGDDMGLGKTLQVLLALDTNARAIVVCPASLKYNWRAEIARWRPDFSAVVLSGRAGFRVPSPGEVVIVNYDILPAWLTPVTTGEKTEKGYDIKAPAVPAEFKAALAESTVVIDEAHLVKNYKTARSQKINGLTRVCARAWALTGTPLTNKPADLFGVLSVVGLAGEAFGSWERFMRMFGAFRDRWGGIQWGEPSLEVSERLRRVMLRRVKTEVLPDLPRKRYAEVVVPHGLDAADADELAAFAAEYFCADEARRSSLPDFSEFSALRAKLATARVPAMLEIVETHEDAETPLLVFSAHRAPIDALADRAGWAVITGDTKPEDRARVVADFQAGKLKGVGLTITAGGVGLTLTHASNVLFVDLDWTPANNLQAEDRVVRIGQEAQSVLITRMVSDHPLEQHVHRLLSRKILLVQKAVENEIAYTAPVVPVITEETDEELAARLAKQVGKPTKRNAKEFVTNIAEREARKAVLPATELTADRAALVREAFAYMLACCDGAVSKDYVGFNKPDAAIAQYVVKCLDSDIGVRTAERMLTRYHRQLRVTFPALFVCAETHTA